MNKPDPKKSKLIEVVPIDVPQVPAITRLLDGWKKFRLLTEQADQIQQRYKQFREKQGKLFDRREGEAPPELRFAQLDDYDKRQIARCRQWLREIDRQDYYEESDDRILKKKIIRDRLALMLSAPHVGGPATPDGFVVLLLAHVADAEPSYLALESACRQIEGHEKYVQTPYEVLEAVRENEQQWIERRCALNDIEMTSDHLQNDIREAQAKYEREQAKKPMREAKYRVSSIRSWLQRDVEQIVAAQERAREAYQEVGAAIDKLVEHQQQLEEAKAALDDAIARGKAQGIIDVG